MLEDFEGDDNSFAHEFLKWKTASLMKGAIVCFGRVHIAV